MKTKMHYEFSKRIIAILMAFVLVAGLAASSFSVKAVDEHEGKVTITVMHNGSPVSGATVIWSIKDAANNEMTVLSNSTGLLTGSDGIVDIMDSDSYQSGFKITATISKEGFADKTITDQEIANESANIDVKIKYPEINPTIILVSGTDADYTGDNISLISSVAIEGGNDGATITYSTNGTDYSPSVPTGKNVGNYDVYVIITKEGYEPFESGKLTATINPVEIPGLELVVSNHIYDGQPYAPISGVTGTLAGDTVTYSIDGSTYVDDPTTLKVGGTTGAVGEYTVYAKINRADNNYKETIIQKSVNITKSPAKIEFNSVQKDVKVDGFNSPDGIVYDFSVDKKVAEGATQVTDGTISYSISTVPAGIATIDNDSSSADFGKVTVNGGGEITVTATSSETANFNSATASHTFKVLEKIELSANDEEYVLNDDKKIDVQPITAKDTTGTVLAEGSDKLGNYTYSISEDQGFGGILHWDSDPSVNAIIIDDLAALEEKMEDADQITIVVTVSMADTGISTQKESISYNLVIKYDDTTDYEISGTKGDNGWYTDKITIKPKESGYTISKTIDNNSFEDEIIFDDQGKTERSFYLKSSTGGLSKKIVLNNISIDSVNPYFSSDAIVYSDALNTAPFNFYNAPVTITFTAYDTTSGVDRFEWKYTRENGSGEDYLAELSGVVGGNDVTYDGEKYTAKIVLPKNTADQLKGHITLRIYDKAGNYVDRASDGVILVVDNISPVANVSYKLKNTTDNQQTVNNKTYYSGDVIVGFDITEANFFAEDINVYLSKDNGARKEIKLTWRSNGSKNTSEYILTEEGDYKVYIDYTDRSDNKMTSYVSDVKVIDKTKPEIKLDYKDFKDGEKPQSVTITITEHNFRKDDIVASSSAEDINGNIVDTNDFQAILRMSEWTTNNDVHTLTVSSDFVDAIYDMGINYSDLALNPAATASIDNFIIDHTAPDASRMTVDYSESLKDSILSNITFGYYNPNVTITFTAYDTTSGVDYFTWSYVKEDGTSDINVSEYVDEKLTAVQDQNDKSKFTASITLPNDQAEQLRGHIAFSATDKFDNVSQTMKDDGHVLVVDTVAPTIAVSYSNPIQISNGKRYYNGNATATISINEANFYDEDVVITVTRDGRTAQATTTWRDVTPDVHIGTITLGLLGDGDYQFTVSYTDRSGNQMQTYTSEIMVIDTTSPNLSVTFANNNLVQNLNGIAYYDGAGGSIAATITIIEHNFNSADAVVTVTRDGSSYPVSVSWSSSGDTNTGSFRLDGDGDYLVTITYNDLARNAAVTFTSGQLTLDTEIEEPIITINGKEDIDGTAYKDEVIPAVSFEDTNLADYDVSIRRTSWADKNVDVSDKFIADNIKVTDTTFEGKFDEFEKVQDNDGIYILNVSATDKAGHETEKTVTFTVNRYGSVYEYSDYLVELISDGGKYVQSVDDDLVIDEFNADKLVKDSLVIEITRDGKPLDNSVYEISPEINDKVTTGSSGWYQYKYVIDRENFSADGIYKISVSSADETGNKPDIANYDDKEILFRVDSTPPEISNISGLEDKIINATEVDVNYTVFDSIGLKAISVYVDGEEIESITDFGDDANNFAGQFKIDEKSSSQDVRIYVEDLAGNITDTSSKEFNSAYKFNSSVTVSTNAFVRWFANKPLFVGSIIGFIALICGGGFLIAFLRRRKHAN